MSVVFNAGLKFAKDLVDGHAKAASQAVHPEERIARKVASLLLSDGINLLKHVKAEGDRPGTGEVLQKDFSVAGGALGGTGSTEELQTLFRSLAYEALDAGGDVAKAVLKEAEAFINSRDITATVGTDGKVSLSMKPAQSSGNPS